MIIMALLPAITIVPVTLTIFHSEGTKSIRDDVRFTSRVNADIVSGVYDSIVRGSVHLLNAPEVIRMVGGGRFYNKAYSALDVGEFVDRDIEWIDKSTESFLESYGYLKEIAYCNANGEVIFSMGQDGSGVRFNGKTFAVGTKPLSVSSAVDLVVGEFEVSGVMDIDNNPDINYTCLSSPIRWKDEYLGMLLMLADPVIYSGVLKNDTDYYSLASVIVDKNNYILASGSPEYTVDIWNLPLDNTFAEQWREKFGDRVEGDSSVNPPSFGIDSGINFSISGKNYVGQYTALPYGDVIVLSFLEQDEVLGKVSIVLWLLLGYMSLAVAAALFLSVLLSRVLTAPLNNLLSSIRRVESGDISYVALESHDVKEKMNELIQISTAFRTLENQLFLEKTEIHQKAKDLELVISSVPGGVFRSSASSPYVFEYVSEGLLRLLGSTDDPPPSFLRIVSGSDCARVAHLLIDWLSKKGLHDDKNKHILEIQFMVKGVINDLWVLSKFQSYTSEKGNELFCVMVDITGMKSVQDKLQIDEKKMRIIYESVCDIICEFDPIADTMRYSPRWREVFGYHPPTAHVDCLVDQAELVHPDDRSLFRRWRAMVNSSREDDGLEESIIRTRKVDGTYIPAYYRGIRLFNLLGQHVKTIIIVTPIYGQNSLEDNTVTDQDDRVRLAHFPEQIWDVFKEHTDPVKGLKDVLKMIGEQFLPTSVSYYRLSSNGKGFDTVGRWLDLDGCGMGTSAKEDGYGFHEMMGMDYETFEASFDMHGITYHVLESTEEKTADVVQEYMREHGIRVLLQCAYRENKSGHLLGYLSLKELLGARQWSESEISAISYASQMIGAYLERYFLRMSLESSESLIQALVNNVDGWAYIINRETYRIIAINKRAGILLPTAKQGMPCYKFFGESKNVPCTLCPLQKFSEDGVALDDIVLSTLYSSRFRIPLKTKAQILSIDAPNDAALLSCQYPPADS